MKKILLYASLALCIACQENSTILPQDSNQLFLGLWVSRGDTVEIVPGASRNTITVVEATEGYCSGATGTVSAGELVVMGQSQSSVCFTARRNGKNLLLSFQDGPTFLWSKVD
ncbi:MAG: hypothetical protein AAF694_07630 [Bacteroidota bacterium]